MTLAIPVQPHSQHFSTKPRIGFVGLAALPLFDPAASGGIGGAEVRAFTLARGLADRGYPVHFVLGETPTSACSERQLQLHVAARPQLPSGRWAAARYLTASLAGKWRGSLEKRLLGQAPRQPFYERLPVDVVCCFGVRNDTASIVRSARRAGKRVVVFVTSDRTLQDVTRRGRRERGVYGEIGHFCRLALRQADAVVAQTRRQQESLAHSLDRLVHCIRNPIRLDPNQVTRGGPPAGVRAPTEPYALWVGRADRFSKRADLFLQLAGLCPEIAFVAVMNRHDPEVYGQLTRQAPPNVQLLERVPFDSIEPYYAQARLLLNTSDVEGFPNSFLQAGKYGVPIVSRCVDPDRMLSRGGCGLVAGGSMAGMREALRALWTDSARYAAVSGRIKAYVRNNHALDDRLDELERLIRTRRRPAAA